MQCYQMLAFVSRLSPVFAGDSRCQQASAGCCGSALRRCACRWFCRCCIIRRGLYRRLPRCASGSIAGPALQLRCIALRSVAPAVYVVILPVQFAALWGLCAPSALRGISVVYRCVSVALRCSAGPLWAGKGYQQLRAGDLRQGPVYTRFFPRRGPVL